MNDRSWVSSSLPVQPFSAVFCWGHEDRKVQCLRSPLTHPVPFWEKGSPSEPPLCVESRCSAEQY